MERIFLSRLVGVFFFFITGSVCFAQNYYVFKKRGKPTINKTETLNRGSVFSDADTLHLGENDYVLFVNKIGDLFEISKSNIYAFSAITDYKKKIEKESLTQKYFVYVWQQFTNQHKRKQEAGVVYREERNIALITPIDSVKTGSPEVKFSWNNKTDKEDLFFFLRDLKTKHLSKIGLTGNALTLSVDNFILKPGQSYEWSVSEFPFPNLNELQFNQLNVLTKEEYQNSLKEINAIIIAFKYLGFSEAEIQEVICSDYKLCSF